MLIYYASHHMHILLLQFYCIILLHFLLCLQYVLESIL